MLLTRSIPDLSRHRFRPTADLLADREYLGWQLTEIMADLERDPDSWACGPANAEYVLVELEDVQAEIARREALRHRPEAPAWPREEPQAYARFWERAQALKRDWPLARFCRDMLLLDLRPAGRDQWKACCPLHQERTPSFVIYPDDHWHCYGACATGGDIYRLIGLYRHLPDFTDQVAELAGLTREEVRRG